MVLARFSCLGIAAAAAAWCAVPSGKSRPFGSAVCSKPKLFDQSGRDTKLHMKKLNAYYDESSSCLLGLKPQFGHKSTGADLVGVEGGKESDIQLGDAEYLVGVKVKAGLK